jgi:hypothetical protein
MAEGSAWLLNLADFHRLSELKVERHGELRAEPANASVWASQRRSSQSRPGSKSTSGSTPPCFTRSPSAQQVFLWFRYISATLEGFLSVVLYDIRYAVTLWHCKDPHRFELLV